MPSTSFKQDFEVLRTQTYKAHNFESFTQIYGQLLDGEMKLDFETTKK